MTGATMVATLERLGVIPSLSRPAVSDDNPYSESLFKTLKYRPSYPDSAFSSIDEARAWVNHFVLWYNTEHLHSAIRFVTPSCAGLALWPFHTRPTAWLESLGPFPGVESWSGKTRNWTPITEVLLNPKKHKTEIQTEFTIDTTTPIARPKVSAMSEAVEQISDISESRSKNGLHSCPITNASDSGEGLPWAENPLSDDLLRSSHRCSKLSPKMNSDYLASDNLP
jgi:Integrase core domain